MKQVLEPFEIRPEEVRKKYLELVDKLELACIGCGYCCMFYNKPKKYFLGYLRGNELIPEPNRYFRFVE